MIRTTTAALLLMLTAGCGATTTQSGESTGAAKAEKSTKSAGIGDTVRDGKFSFKVTKVRQGVKRVGPADFGKKAQGQFVLVNVTVKNTGDEAQSLAGDAQKIIDAKGREYSADTEAAIYLDDSNSLFEEINPGNTLKGIVVFDVPKAVKPAQIELHDSLFSGGTSVSLR